MKYTITVGATIIETITVNAADETNAQAKALRSFDKIHHPPSDATSYEVTVLECKPDLDDALLRFGQKLRKLREEANIEQAAFAKMLNLHPSSVNHWEAGRNWPNMERILAMCAIFKVSVSEMMGC